MLLSGCKGNTFFWKNTFFYGLICIRSEKTQKTAWFISQQTDFTEDQEQRKRACFVVERNRIVGFFAQNKLKRMHLLNILQSIGDYNRKKMYLCTR